MKSLWSQSYSLLMEAQTENAFQILDQRVFYGCNIPKQCKFDTISIYAADNIDLKEEILFGINKSDLFLTLATRSNHFQNKPQPEQKSRDVSKKNIFTKIKISFIEVNFLLQRRILKFFSILKEFPYLKERQ